MNTTASSVISTQRILAAIAFLVMVVIVVLYFVSNVGANKLLVLFLFTWGLWMVLNKLLP